MQPIVGHTHVYPSQKKQPNSALFPQVRRFIHTYHRVLHPTTPLEMMIEVRSNQILVYLSATHLDECRQWQHEIEAEWLQVQQQTRDSPEARRLPIPRRGGAIGGAFTYMIRLTLDSYHLKVHDAVSGGERDWTVSGDCSDFVVFAMLHEREYGLLIDWFTQFEDTSFDHWVQSLQYTFCDNTLGRLTRVRDLHTERQLDLTDYEGW